MMTGRQKLAGVLIVASLVGTVQCRPVPEKPRKITPPAQAASPDTTAGPASLENTSWKLTHLGESPVMVPYGNPQPHLILDSSTRRAGGLGICNRFGGSYQLNGDRLRLGPMTATLMLCAEDMETERAFFGTLWQVRRWRISGQRLELLNAADSMLARFQAGSLSPNSNAR